jgi:hypothetical protein
MLDTLETLAYCLILMLVWIGISFVMGIVVGKAMGVYSDRGE